MSQTWEQFRTGVIGAYGSAATGSAREEAAIQAVADYVKSRIVREVDSDLPLRQSYLNSYNEARLRLAGYRITSNFATVLAGVNTRITVDATRDPLNAASGFNEKMVQQGIDDFNGASDLFEAHLVDAAVEIQRKARCYQSGHRSTYLKGDSGVVASGLASVITLPTTASVEIAGVLYGFHWDALAISTAYDVDDAVLSNGRVYRCTTAGTSAGSLGAGLTVTDDSEQFSGTAGFVYHGPTELAPAGRVGWASRQVLLQGGSCISPAYTTNPAGTELTLYPALDDDHELVVDWNGLKLSFADGDTVPFDDQCELAAAEYVRAMLQRLSPGEANQAATSYAVWQARLRRLWQDCFARSAGRP